MLGSSHKPNFRFHPNAYEACFERSSEACDVSGEPCRWRYTGNIYGPPITDDLTLSAKSLAAGSLANLTGEDGFSFQDVDFEDDVAESLQSEIFERTPGVASFNPFTWPVLEGFPLAYIGTGAEYRFWKNKSVRIAMQSAWEVLELEIPLSEPNESILLFQTLDKKHYRAVVDLD